MRALVALTIAACLAGCAEASSSESGPVTPRGGRVGAGNFGAWEGHWLEELAATDPRLALRMHDKPNAEVLQKLAAGSVIRGAGDVGIVGGAIDLFSFDARAMQLRSLRQALGISPEDGTPTSRAEKVLLAKLIDGEELRVTRERETPESASERVRAMVQTWGRPASTREVDEREHLVARGLLIVVADVKEGRLQGPRVLELEDSLDALERLAVPEGYPLATQAITSLRVELGKVHPRAAARSSLTPLAIRLDAYLGIKEAREDLVLRLQEEETSLRIDAKSRLAHFPEHTVDDALAAAAEQVDRETPCAVVGGASPVRAMSPPPERALVCDVLQLVASANLPLEEAVATVAIHDDVAVALWALDLERGATDLDATRTAHPLLASVKPDRQDRLVRAALVSPVPALAAGLAVTIVDAEGIDAKRDRAKRWLTFGDAPFDAVGEYLKAPQPPR